MGKVKPDALALIEKMSEDSNWDQILYQIYVRSRIEEGLAEIEAGRCISHEQFKLESMKWLEHLFRPVEGIDLEVDDSFIRKESSETTTNRTGGSAA